MREDLCLFVCPKKIFHCTPTSKLKLIYSELFLALSNLLAYNKFLRVEISTSKTSIAELIWGVIGDMRLNLI